MKILMILLLIGFLASGAIGFCVRLSHDWNQLAVESDKLDENSLAKRDGRAMQLVQKEENTEIDITAAKKKADQRFHLQLIFSLLSVACLIGAIICGAMMQ